jgi:lipoprotein NlpI
MRRAFIAIILLFLAGAVALAHSDESDKAIDEAKKCLKRHDHDGALKAAEKAIMLDAKDPQAWFVRAQAYGELRKPEQAIKDYAKAFELDPKYLIAVNERGGERFKSGDIKGSIADFEKYIEANPAAFEDHWRYGISLYYDGRFADGAKQFKAGDKAYANDVENAFWHYLCNARVDGAEKARKSLLAIGRDGRVPMMKVYDLIAGKAKPEEVIETAEKAKLEGERRNEALFYAHLYVGLNYEAEGNAKKCLEHLTMAVEKHKIGHYMWDVGNVHLLLMKKK